MRFPPTFDEGEGAVLVAMYEVPNGTYDSYSLSERLNPEIEVGTPSAASAFIETRSATERLIVRRLVCGDRLSGANGVYFKKLKLTQRGEQAAIVRRKQVEDGAKALAAAACEADKEFGHK